MAELAELALAAGEILEGIKLVREGVISGWETVTDGYDYIKNFFGSKTTAPSGYYNNQLLAQSLCSKTYVLPSDMHRFISYVSSSDIVNPIIRTEVYSRMFELQRKPAWIYGLRFPDTVCLPVHGIVYYPSFNGMYTELNSISLITKSGKIDNILPHIQNYNNHLAELVKNFASGAKFTDRSTFETTYKLKWLIK